MTGAQGVAGLNVPAGTIIWLVSGTRRRTGITCSARPRSRSSVRDRKARNVLFDVYREELVGDMGGAIPWWPR